MANNKDNIETDLALFRDLINKSNDAIFVNDPQSSLFIFVNDKACASLGYTRQELLKMGVKDIDTMFPDNILWQAHVNEVKRSGSHMLEGIHKRKDGTTFPVEVNVSYIPLDRRDYMLAVVRDITERKQTSEALRIREKQLAESQRIAHLGSWEHNLATGQVFWSEELFRLYGLDPRTDPVNFKIFFDMVHPDDQPVLKEAIDETVRLHTPLNIDFRFILKNGSKRIFHAQGELIYDDTGTQAILSGTSQDITERKKAEEALLKFQMAVDSATDAIGMSTPEGRHYYQNRAFTKLFGLSVSEVAGVSGPPATVYVDEKVGTTIFATLMSGGAFAGEVKMLDKDRNERDIYLRAYSIKSKEGDVVGLVGVHTDITDRKKSEEKLRKSESQLRESQEVARLGNWDLDLVSQKLEWSDETYKLFEKNREEFIPSFDAFAQLVHPDDLETMQTNFNNALKSDDSPYHVAVRIINDSGREWVMEAFGAVRRDKDSSPVGIFGTAQDITERKQAEEKIRESEKFIRNVLDTVDEGFIVIDRDYRILTANKAYCSQVGEPSNSIIGRPCYEISHKTLRPCYEEGEECAVRHVFQTGEPHSALHKHPDSKGSILYVETKAFPIKDSTGAVTSVIETVNNITEKHLLEEERLKTQKLEAIGTLAGGIAHDFNNLLQGVFGYISMAKITHDQKERSLAMLEQAEQALHLSVNLTTQLLTFSKGGKPVRTKINLQPLVENSVKFALSGSRVDYRIKLDDDLWSVDADAGQISQVIQNIVLNADQAMPMGGTVSVNMKNVDAPAKGIPTSLKAGKYVEITMADTGIGISEQYLSKIFDPYFTTKDKGSGLGLATSYSIIRNHGGLIDVKSKPGAGTTFVVYIPAIGEEEATRDTIPTTTVTAKRGKILVMDDEEMVRNIAGIMLAALGHEVEFAKNGEEAVAKYREALLSSRRFDIVILDVTIRGGKGGEETLQELIALDPDVTAVVSSGYSDNAAVSEYRSHGFRACLTKPYEIDTLRNTLNALLK